MTADPRINSLAQRAQAWVQTASPAELWDAMQKSDIGTRVGMPDIIPRLGGLVGPGSFIEELRVREWAADAHGDLAQWFANSPEAQRDAREEIYGQIAEVFFNIGDWEWVEPGPPPDDGPLVR